MAFPRFVETDEQERERLAEYGRDNPRLAALAEMPVTVDHPGQTTIIVLPDGFWHDGRIVVLPLRVHHSKPRERNFENKLMHDGHWTCRVLGGTSPTYAPGGHDIVVSEAELRRGRQIVIDQELIDWAASNQ